MLLRDQLEPGLQTTTDARVLEQICFYTRKSNFLRDGKTFIALTYDQIREQIPKSQKTIQRVLSRLKKLGLILIEYGRHPWKKDASNCMLIHLKLDVFATKFVKIARSFFGLNVDKESMLTWTKSPCCTYMSQKKESAIAQSAKELKISSKKIRGEKKKIDISKMSSQKPSELQNQLNEKKKDDPPKPRLNLPRLFAKMQSAVKEEDFEGSLGDATGANIGRTKTICKRIMSKDTPMSEVESVILYGLHNWEKYRKHMFLTYNEDIAPVPNMKDLTYHASGLVTFKAIPPKKPNPIIEKKFGDFGF